MGRERPIAKQYQRVRVSDRSKCEGSRILGVTARLPPARKLVRRRKSLVDDRIAAKNRVRVALADRGITYDGDLFGDDGREFLAREELPSVHC
jgi:hypothetical protein